MRGIYDRKDLRGWADEYLNNIYEVHERWRADGTIRKQGSPDSGRTARSFALVVRQERRKRGLGT